MTDPTSRYKNLGPLQDLLLRACPPGTNGKKSIPALARKLGLSHQYLYQWIDEQIVPAKYIGKIVTLSEGLVETEDFLEYLF